MRYNYKFHYLQNKYIPFTQIYFVENPEWLLVVVHRQGRTYKCYQGRLPARRQDNWRCF